MMQLILAQPGQPETGESFTLMLPHIGIADRDPRHPCPLCNTRESVWLASPASEAAMNPEASPIGAGECCATCLNQLLEERIVEVTHVDPDSF